METLSLKKSGVGECRSSNIRRYEISQNVTPSRALLSRSTPTSQDSALSPGGHERHERRRAETSGGRRAVIMTHRERSKGTANGQEGAESQDSAKRREEKQDVASSVTFILNFPRYSEVCAQGYRI